MSDKTVEHRFVQIHQACKNASTTQEDEIWSRLALKSTSTIATSHACEKLCNRLANSEFDLLASLQNLQNLIITSNETAKSILFLRVITRVLLKQPVHPSFDHVKYSAVDYMGHKIDYQVHPFVNIMRQKPNLYYYILDEIDYMFDNSYHPNIPLYATLGFIKAVFWMENSVDAGALIARLNNNITFENAEEMLPTMFGETLKLVENYPLHKDNQHYFLLVDWIIWQSSIAPFAFNIEPTSDSSSEMGLRSTSSISYVYSLIDRLLTAVTDGESGLAYLIRLERILKNLGLTYNYHVVWSSLAYALLKVQSIEEQKSIVRLMAKTNMKDRVGTALILRIAYIPLYQFLSELNDKGASKDMVELKKDVLNLIAFLDSAGALMENAENERDKLLRDKDLYRPIHGMLGRLRCYLEYIYYHNKASILVPENNAGTDSMLVLTMLFSTPYVFSNDDETAYQVYSRIAEISSLHETSYKFPILLFFLRRLHVSSGNARLVTLILKDAIPMLVDVSDPIITSKVLQVILTSINNSGSNDSSMASLGVKALAHTHQLQPRVWQELKKVFAEWVLRRKSGTVRRKIDLSKTCPIKMELTVLTTMRDVCKSRPRECAPDVLPMIISLLQTCQDLSMASLSIMVDIITTCVEAGLVESRSIWNIAVVYLAQFSLDQGVQKSILLVKQLCRFYSVAGAKNDDSEPYLQFKESMLKSYILPLIESGHDEAISHAIGALADFPAQDIALILPEKATDYILQCTSNDSKPNENQHKVLAALMSNELDHMRRGLFKEEAAKKQQSSTAMDIYQMGSKKSKITNDAGEVVGERESEMETSFINNWENARVAPGLRSGYATAILHLLDNKNSPETTKLTGAVNIEGISKTKWYRYMVTAFTDVSLTDHLLIRVSSVKSWEAFFKNALSGTENDMEVIVSLLLKDLLLRLERSTVPGVTCNIALAMTGLVSTVGLFIPSFAASCANEITDVLMKNYIVLSGSPLSHSAHLMSEEVQFAARFALGHLAAFGISNDKLATSLYNVLMDSATSNNNKSRSIDTAVDLVQFANGYAAGHFIASLAMWPTVTDQIENMKNTGMKLLIEHCGTPAASDGRVLGIMMGLASKLKPAYMGEELSFAVRNLETYLGGEGINKGLLFGSTWLAAAGALKESQVDYEISGIVESVMTAASSDVNSAQHFYNFSVPYTQIQLHSYLYSDANDSQTGIYYWNAFEPLLTSIQNDDAASNYRIASLFSLGSLLGVNYLNIEADNEYMYTEAERYRPALTQRALEKLAYVAGLNSKSAPIGNLKSGRVAAAVCGKVIETAKSMMYALKSASNPEDASSAGEKSVMSLLSASSEPVSYSRLNNNTSYIRATFDRLVAIASDQSQVNNIALLLKCLIETPGPLPPVNWFTLVSKISKLSTHVHALCLSFASAHAICSLSLSEFLLTQMATIFTAIQSTANLDKTLCGVFFLNGKGLGTVLELAGLPRLTGETKEEKKRRGMNAVIKRITISESRAIEIIELLGQKYKFFEYDTQYALLSILADHLPSSTDTVDENKAKFVSSIRSTIMQSMTLYTFDHVTSFADDMRHESNYEMVVRKSVECSVTDISELFRTGRLEDWLDVSDQTVFARVAALSEFYRLHFSKKQLLTKYVSATMVQLIKKNYPDKYAKEIWRVIGDLIQQDCRSDKDELAWMIRLLDAYVVYIGALPEMGDVEVDDLSTAMKVSLSTILEALQACTTVESCNGIKQYEIGYALGNFVTVDSGYKVEQEQIVKRIFKIRDMLHDAIIKFGFNSLFELFIRSLPSEFVTQYESKYY